MPTHFLAEPHTLSPLTHGMLGYVIGKDYPCPIIDHKKAVAEARRKLGVFSERPSTQRERARMVAENGYLNDRHLDNRQPQPVKKAA